MERDISICIQNSERISIYIYTHNIVNGEGTHLYVHNKVNGECISICSEWRGH